MVAVPDRRRYFAAAAGEQRLVEPRPFAPGGVGRQPVGAEQGEARRRRQLLGGRPQKRPVAQQPRRQIVERQRLETKAGARFQPVAGDAPAPAGAVELDAAGLACVVPDRQRGLRLAQRRVVRPSALGQRKSEGEARAGPVDGHDGKRRQDAARRQRRVVPQLEGQVLAVEPVGVLERDPLEIDRRQVLAHLARQLVQLGVRGQRELGQHRPFEMTPQPDTIGQLPGAGADQRGADDEHAQGGRPGAAAGRPVTGDDGAGDQQDAAGQRRVVRRGRGQQQRHRHPGPARPGAGVPRRPRARASRPRTRAASANRSASVSAPGSSRSPTSVGPPRSCTARLTPSAASPAARPQAAPRRRLAAGSGAAPGAVLGAAPGAPRARFGRGRRAAPRQGRPGQRGDDGDSPRRGRPSANATANSATATSGRSQRSSCSGLPGRQPRDRQEQAPGRRPGPPPRRARSAAGAAALAPSRASISRTGASSRETVTRPGRARPPVDQGPAQRRRRRHRRHERQAIGRQAAAGDDPPGTLLRLQRHGPEQGHGAEAGDMAARAAIQVRGARLVQQARPGPGLDRAVGVGELQRQLVAAGRAEHPRQGLEGPQPAGVVVARHGELGRRPLGQPVQLAPDPGVAALRPFGQALGGGRGAGPQHQLPDEQAERDHHRHADEQRARPPRAAGEPQDRHHEQRRRGPTPRRQGGRGDDRQQPGAGDGVGGEGAHDRSRPRYC